MSNDQSETDHQTRLTSHQNREEASNSQRSILYSPSAPPRTLQLSHIERTIQAAISNYTHARRSEVAEIAQE